MTKKEFYDKYWPRIKGKEVDIKSGYVQSAWSRGVIIDDVRDYGRDIYFKYRINYGYGPATVRSVTAIATITETDLKPNT